MPVEKPPIRIELEHVSYRYSDNDVLRDVSVTIREGEYVGLIGPNGGGKTTLLKLLLGILIPTKGSIKVFGLPPASTESRRRIGYVPQRLIQSEPRFPATVEEIVMSGRTARIGIGSRFGASDREAVQNALHSAGLTKEAHDLFGTLSGGQRQRALIARALAAEASILILDEPTVGIDAHSRDRFYSFLRTLNTEHKLTILHVSHDVDDIAREVGHLLQLNQTLVCHGDPADVLKEYHSHAAY